MEIQRKDKLTWPAHVFATCLITCNEDVKNENVMRCNENGENKNQTMANRIRHNANFYKISLLILLMDILVFTDHVLSFS